MIGLEQYVSRWVIIILCYVNNICPSVNTSIQTILLTHRPILQSDLDKEAMTFNPVLLL